MSKKNNDSDFMVKYTTRDVIEKIDAEAKSRREADKNTTEILDKILVQAKYTNGRVTTLENKSIGVWISSNPFKFVIVCLALAGLFVKETRDLIIQAVLKFFIG